MEIKNIKCWNDFEQEIENLYFYAENFQDDQAVSAVSAPLFRGQGNSGWPLETTLDRVKKGCSMSEYYLILQNNKPIIESFTDRNWKIPKFEEPRKTLWVTPDINVYSFMAYLRHHKFPSPLLDWTRSPYLAAFFAASDIKSNTNLAIFAYIEDIGQGKTAEGKKATISSLGPDITTHKRHHLQQCEYTVCTKKIDSKMYYCGHEEVFTEDNPDQDLLKKYILPSSERKNILKKLDLMNINAYSLLHNEEGLMDTLSIREFFIEKF